MRLLFLDIDGVLNSYRTDIVLGEDRTIEELDPIAVGLVKDIVATTGCIICLSSDWRLSHDYMELGKKLGLPILFETMHKEMATRGDEIQLMLDAIQPDKYVILDDVSAPRQKPLESQKDNFVHVKTADGMGYQDYLNCVSILSNQE